MADEKSTPRQYDRRPDTAQQRLIVGLDGREHDADAVALAGSLQLALGGRILFAHVISLAPPGPGMVEFEALQRRRGRELLDEVATHLSFGGETVLVEPTAAASGLSALATERHANLLVLGSSHRGGVGRIVPGGVASHLLTHAPCAIAVAPAGYAKRAHDPIGQIGIAYDATSEADAALAAAADAAGRLSARLRLYHAMHEISKDPAWDTFREHMSDFAQGVLDTGVRRIPPEVEVTTSVLEGDTAETIAGAARADGVGLLYAGSRGYGPLRDALLGGVAGALLHTAHVPLVIVPRSARSGTDE